MSETARRGAQASPFTRAGFYGPLIVFLTIAAAVLTFTQERRDRRLERLRRQTGQTVASVAGRLEERMASRIVLLRRLRDLNSSPALRPEVGTSSAADLLGADLASQLGIAAIVRLPPSGPSLPAAPGESAGLSTGRSLLEDPAALPFFDRARDEQADQVSNSLHLFNGGWGFAGFFPVVRDGRTTEILAAFFRYADLVERTVDASILGDFNLQLRDLEKGRVVYERWNGGQERAAGFTRSAELRIAGHRYEAVASPAATLAAEASRGIWLERGFGLVLAALIALSARLVGLRGFELQRRDQLISGLLSGLPLTVFRFDRDGVLVEARGRGAEALGLGRLLGEREFGREPAELAAAVEAAAGGRPAGCELQLGSSYFDVSLLPDEVHPGGVVGFAHEVTGRHEVEATLRQSESHFRGFFHEAPFGYLVADGDGRITLANLEAARLVGRSPAQLAGRQLIDVFGAGKRDRLSAAQVLEKAERGEEIRDHELRLTRPDGKTFWCSLSVQAVSQGGEYAGGHFVLFDISRRKELEERLRQSGKMEALGRFAGGITHDFNNLLTAIMGFARLARGRLAAGSPLERDLGEIEKAGKRATALVARLLAFARQQPAEARVVDLNARVRDLAAMLRRLVREDIELELRLGDAGSARIDPDQLEQLLVALVMNAVEATTGRGHIVIETSTRHATGEEPHSRIRVIDDGRGMSPEIQEHLFEPFFTTKSPEEGSGLGLATVYGIVEQHQGRILVDSEPGLGTTVTVLFPRVAGEARAVAPTTLNLPPSGQERVLVVEDEEQVREMAKEMLELLGYRAEAARDGRHALELVAGREAEVDLLLTDVVMPNVGGEALYHALKARHPGLKVLFTSGYTDDPFIRKSVEAGELPFLQKPYTLDSLALALRAALRGQ